MNPADRLAALLRSWQAQANQSPFDTRGGDRGDGGLATLQDIGLACALVRQIEQALDGLDEVNVKTAAYRVHTTSWYRAVLSFSQALGTQTSNPSQVIDPPALGALDMLGTLLDQASPDRDIPENEREAIVEALDEVLDLVISASGLTNAERIALLGLIRAAQRVLGRLDFVGPDELELRLSRISLELANQSIKLAQRGDRKLAETFYSASRKVAAFVTLAVAVGGLDEIGSEVVKGITGAN